MIKVLLAASLCGILLICCTQTIVRQDHSAKRPPPPKARSQQKIIVNAHEVAEDSELASLRRRILADPQNFAVRLELGAKYEALGSWELAIEHYRMAAMQSPDSAPIALHLAKAARNHGLLREAANVMVAFLTNHAAASDYWSWTGILCDDAGLIVEGEEYHRQAIYRSEKAQAFLHNNLGHNLLLQGRNGDAAGEFRKALALEPRLTVARNNLAVALAHNPAEAIQHMQSISDPATAHSNVAALLIDQGRYQEARKELQIALSYRSDHPAALRNLSLLSALDGQPPIVELTPKHELGGAQSATGGALNLQEKNP